MDEYIINTNNLTRYFGKKCVISSINFKIPKGCVFALLGRNGAGKTTLIRMLLGFLEPTRGSSAVFGCDSINLTSEIRSKIGYLAEGHNVYGWMKISECESFQSSFFPGWNHNIFNKVISHFNLDPTSKVRELSRGERAGLCLALTMAQDPELLVLDDPALGLDPIARRSLLESMVYLTRKGEKTILFSSHLLSDVERVADRISIIKKGALNTECTLDTFRQSISRIILHFSGSPPEIGTIPGLLHSFTCENRITVSLLGYDENTEHMLKKLGTEKIEKVPLSLEDAFISYLREGEQKSFFTENSGDIS